MDKRKIVRLLRDNVSFSIPANVEAFAKKKANLPQEEPTGFSDWKKLVVGFSAFAAVFLLTFTLAFQFVTKAQISLDINPSLQLDINLYGRVKSIQALNDEGETVLDALDRKSGSLADVIESISITTDELGYAADADQIMLFGISAKDFDRETKLAADIIFICQEHNQDAYVLKTHTSSSQTMFSGFVYEYDQYEQQESAVTTTTMATLPASTAATTSVSGITAPDANDAINFGSTYKYSFMTIGAMDLEEFQNLALSLGITEAKLQVVLKVFMYYPEFYSEADLQYLAEMSLQDLMPLYDAAIGS